MKDIAKLIGMGRCHEDFKAISGGYAYDMQGWCGGGELFDRLIAEVQPKLIVEIGTWKGKSAIMMAESLVRNRLLDSRVLCIDTWLGATEFIDKPDDDPKRGLRRIAGWPEVYYTFMKNVQVHGMERMIVPFPQTSANALRFLFSEEIVAGLIYVDASHEYDDVMSDINMSFGILDGGGIMFGDDYCDHWIGVKHAVEDCIKLFGDSKRLETFNYKNGAGQPDSDYWVIRPNIK